MEWVETTGRTVDEAKSKALDQLGVAEDDAEITILDEPKPGLFGRVRGEARVRARVRPTQPRAKAERRDRKKKSDKVDETIADDAVTVDEAVTDDAVDETPARKPAARQNGSAERRPARREGSSSRREPATSATAANGTADTAEKESTVDAEQVGQEAQRFVQGLVDAFGIAGTTTVHRDDDDIEVKVDGTDLGLLVGPRGSTLQAVQELTRVASQRRLGDHDTRLRVDVGGYRERRKIALTSFAEQVAAQVVADGSPKRLEPMSSSDRKIIHDVLSEYDGVVTHSEGDDPRRCVVIAPAND
ncbi:MAG: RNA-binding cell elongation regulator Jag/EloR [Ilumatobacteraceae bacterium]